MARLIKPKKPKEILIKIYKIQAFNNIYNFNKLCLLIKN